MVGASELNTTVKPTQLADEPSVRDSELCEDRGVVKFCVELIQLNGKPSARACVVYFFVELTRLAAGLCSGPHGLGIVRLGKRCASKMRASAVLLSPELRKVDTSSLRSTKIKCRGC